MAPLRDLPIDLYSPLSHKQPLNPDGTGSTAASWIPKRDRRRIDAYRVLGAYLRNVARWFDRDDPEDPEGWKNRREYGDPAVLVRRVRAAVLGDDLQVVVDGADLELPEMPELPDEPAEPGDDASELDRRIYRIAKARWEAEATAVVDEWEQALNDMPRLQERQEWLRRWAELEQLQGKAVEAVGDTVGLGDGIYALFPSSRKGRPVLATYDPGFYFPVLDDAVFEEFPGGVHLAWEFEVDLEDGRVERYVRRLTWELVPVGVAVGAGLDPDADDTAVAFDEAIAGDEATIWWTDPTTGVVSLRRWYPWQDRTAEGAEPSAEACLFSDGTWRLDDIHGTHTDLTADGAAWAVSDDGRLARNLDWRIDFIPIVHLSCTPDTREHFGESILLQIAQILDDIAQGDTDLDGAAGIAALPIVGLFGAEKDAAQRMRSGEVWSSTNPQGSMTVLDLAKAIPELRHLQDDRLERLSVNSSVPAEVLGRTGGGSDSAAGSDQLSGISRLLKQGTFKQLIEEMRLTVHDPKHELLLKMVQRMAQAMGVLPPGPNPVARLAFGSYLPADLAQVVSMVKDLLTAHAISRRTALRLLVAAGLEIEDATEELAAIDAEDTAAAVQVADATGSEREAAKRLGIDPDELPSVAEPATSVTPTVTLDQPPAGTEA